MLVLSEIIKTRGYDAMPYRPLVTAISSNGLVYARLTPVQAHNAIILMGLPLLLYRPPFIAAIVGWSNVSFH